MIEMQEASTQPSRSRVIGVTMLVVVAAAGGGFVFGTLARRLQDAGFSGTVVSAMAFGFAMIVLFAARRRGRCL